LVSYERLFVARSISGHVFRKDRASGPGMVRTGVTFERAADEWLRYCVEDRACKPSTMVDYRHTVGRVLVPVFGELMLDGKVVEIVCAEGEPVDEGRVLVVTEP
jgi:hypothetical protein